jgi:hypothetical protein
VSTTSIDDAAAKVATLKQHHPTAYEHALKRAEKTRSFVSLIPTAAGFDMVDGRVDNASAIILEPPPAVEAPRLKPV